MYAQDAPTLLNSALPDYVRCGLWAGNTQLFLSCRSFGSGFFFMPEFSIVPPEFKTVFLVILIV